MAERKPLPPSTERVIDAALASSDALIQKLNSEIQQPTASASDLNTILTGGEKPAQKPRPSESPLNDILKQTQ